MTLQHNGEPVWRQYLTNYNEGLGLVYERFVLNDFLANLRARHGLHNVLEAPLYGMAGVSGINSVALAQQGVDITLVDDEAERLQGVQRIWREDLQLPMRPVLIAPHSWGRLPFHDRSFDLTWEWAGLWYIQDPGGLLHELVRTSRNLVLVAMPDHLQAGYWLRKWLIDRPFFREHDGSWTDLRRIQRILEQAGLEIIEEGVLDVPPWPDTVMPAGEVLQRLGMGHPALTNRFRGDNWRWSTMAYYMGHEPSLHARVMPYAWLDHAPIPWQAKAIWAHHRYLLGSRRREAQPIGAAPCLTWTKSPSDSQPMLRPLPRWSPTSIPPRPIGSHRPDAWSILEVINHLYDEEREDFRRRLDLTLHHPDTPWPPIDPPGWVTRRRYNRRDLAGSLANFCNERRHSILWLAGLQQPDWQSARQHPAAGRITAGDLLAAWLVHDQLHLRQLVELQYLYAARTAGDLRIEYAGDW